MPSAFTRALMAYSRFRYWRPLERMAWRPDLAQQDALARVLAANRDARFGIEHGFADTRGSRMFQDRVPIQDYETLRPYIDDQRSTGATALTAEAPTFYTQTSGTTSQPKHIPMTPALLAMHRDEQALFSYLQFRACPSAFDGKALGIMGAAAEGRLDSGHLVGSVSGHLYQALPRAVRSRFVVPPEVFSIADYDLKYLVILALALAQPEVTYVGTPNPSTLLRLLTILNEQRDPLLHALKTGRLQALDALAPALREEVSRRLVPDPSRAAALEVLPQLTFANVWPRIRLVTTWTGGSCGIALANVRAKLPSRTMVMELGYQSSECRGTLAVEAETPAGLPPLHHHFFEFVEQAAWERGHRDCQTLAQLEVGRRYYVLLTTIAGLYRYFMNDLVEVTGFLHRTPLLRFVQKGRGVTSVTGEKLYEAQAIEAVQAVAENSGLAIPFFLLVADEEQSRYHLYVEVDGTLGEAEHDPTSSVADEVDRRLSVLNVEYHSKRTSGRLRPLTVGWLRTGAAEAYRAAAVRRGQREGQFKPAALQYRKDMIVSFDEFVVE